MIGLLPQPVRLPHGDTPHCRQEQQEQSDTKPELHADLEVFQSHGEKGCGGCFW